MSTLPLTKWRLAHLAAVIILLAVIAAGCGGGSKNGGGSGTNASGNQGFQTASLRFARCMREHGVNLPDPGADGTIRIGVGSGGSGASGGSAGGSGTKGALSPSPGFAKAQEACKQYLPQSGLSSGDRAKIQTKFLEFARCMRAHGVPNFPDPTFKNGQIAIGGAGINPSDPATKKATAACQSVLPAAPGSGG